MGSQNHPKSFSMINSSSMKPRVSTQSNPLLWLWRCHDQTLCTHYMWTVYMHFPLLMATPKKYSKLIDWPPWIQDRTGAFFDDVPVDITAPAEELTAHVRDGDHTNTENAALSKSVSFKLLSRKKNSYILYGLRICGMQSASGCIILYNPICPISDIWIFEL